MQIQFTNIDLALRWGAPTPEEQRIIDQVVKNNGLDAKRSVDKLLTEHPERIDAIRSFLCSFPNLWWDHRHLEVNTPRSKESASPLQAPSAQSNAFKNERSEENKLFRNDAQEDWDNDTTPLLASNEREQALKFKESKNLGNPATLRKRTKF